MAVLATAFLCSPKAGFLHRSLQYLLNSNLAVATFGAKRISCLKVLYSNNLEMIDLPLRYKSRGGGQGTSFFRFRCSYISLYVHQRVAPNEMQLARSPKSYMLVCSRIMNMLDPRISASVLRFLQYILLQLAHFYHDTFSLSLSTCNSNQYELISSMVAPTCHQVC